jgi:hypothetical protein
MGFPNPGTGAQLNHLTPRPIKGLFGDNYLSITDLDFTQQFLPEVYEKEVERYGNRTISGFLRMVGAEMPMASDVIVWSEQGRLHVAFDDCTIDQSVAATNTITFVADPAGTAGAQTATQKAGLLATGATINITAGLNSVKARVSSTYTAGDTTVTVTPYGAADLTALGLSALTGVKVFVYGSEYGKGSGDVGNSIDAKFTQFNNKPIILRDKYNVNGSDVAQIGWVEVATEAGTSGYLWYLKSEHEARLRFEDQLEMSMIEAVKDDSGIAGGAGAAGFTGSEGLFAAIEDRGLIYNDPDFGAAATAGAPFGGLTEFDAILAELDKQGAIEENMLFLDRSTSLAIDNMLAQANNTGVGGTSYGVFENSEDMALNLGFSGFRRGSYDFYKTDWKYLNDSTTRGLVNDVLGVVVPAGVSTVYDQQLGQNIQRPFLHVRYRASEADDRKMKSWITGSVGGNFTSATDEMNVHFLSERALCTQGANNFVLLKKTTVTP